MPSQRPKRSTEELHRVWGHLVYEIQMLNETANILSTFKADPASDRDRIIQCALIESFALHARNLTAFLYAETPQPDDVVADDFLDDQSVWQRRQRPMSDLLNTVHPRVAKEVAHLTYSRVGITDEQRLWPFVKIADEINLALNKFKVLVPSVVRTPPTPGVPTTAQGPQGFVTEVGSKGPISHGKPGV